jgi:hypothetical protein
MPQNSDSSMADSSRTDKPVQAGAEKDTISETGSDLSWEELEKAVDKLYRRDFPTKIRKLGERVTKAVADIESTKDTVTTDPAHKTGPAHKGQGPNVAKAVADIEGRELPRGIQRRTREQGSGRG